MKIDTMKKGAVFSTARIEVEGPGEKWYGTTILIAREGLRTGDPQAYYFVTCRHVVEHGLTAHLFFNRYESGGAARLGDRLQVTVDNLAAKWAFHPDPRVDIAVAPFDALFPETASPVVPYILPLDRELIPTDEDTARLDVIEEVIFVGYPAGYYDRVNLIPVTRQGITASPLQLDYDGRREFLVDGAVYFGSSGGPVFLIRHGMYVEDGQIKVGPNKFLFLGIISEVLRTTFDGHVGFIHPAATREGVAAARLLNLGVVLKSSLVIEAVDWHLENRAVLAP